KKVQLVQVNRIWPAGGIPEPLINSLRDFYAPKLTTVQLLAGPWLVWCSSLCCKMYKPNPVLLKLAKNIMIPEMISSKLCWIPGWFILADIGLMEPKLWLRPRNKS